MAQGTAKAKDSLLHKKYVIPFALACDSGLQSGHGRQFHRIGYNPTILLQAGLPDFQAHAGYVILTLVNCHGDHYRRCAGGPPRAEIFIVHRQRGNYRVVDLHRIAVSADGAVAGGLPGRSAGDGGSGPATHAQVLRHKPWRASWERRVTAPASIPPESLIVFYSYGDFRAATKVARSDDATAKPLELTRKSCVPANKVVAWFQNPFADLTAARAAPLKIAACIQSLRCRAARTWMAHWRRFRFWFLHGLFTIRHWRACWLAHFPN